VTAELTADVTAEPCVPSCAVGFEFCCQGSDSGTSPVVSTRNILLLSEVRERGNTTYLFSLLNPHCLYESMTAGALVSARSKAKGVPEGRDKMTSDAARKRLNYDATQRVEFGGTGERSYFSRRSGALG
jgi:hypothetical protein